jgi:predicted ATPase/class 3 adenylate cyclase/transcriptional regulator with XRE-family HTH domain
MSNAPSGTVTFLFTDIEGSTKRWEAHPQAMSAALSRHDAILRSAIDQAGGFIFKTVGDAFYAAFYSPFEALAAALAAQQALFAQDWGQDIGELRVRMAVHVGVAEQRDGDYLGQPLNRVARLLSAAHGGQVLISDPAYDLVRDNLPSGITIMDMGEQGLKDLLRPEHVYQLVIPGLPSHFPPLKTMSTAIAQDTAMATSITFGQWLRQQRKVLDLTQEELAMKIDCSWETVRKFEAGTRHPSKQVAQLLADFFSVSPDERAAFIRFARSDVGGERFNSINQPHDHTEAVYPTTNNLPVQPNVFVGREGQIRDVTTLLRRNDVRLVTLTGPGGIGKTRLALQITAALLNDFDGEVWYAELAPLTDHKLVVSTIAQVLGVTEEPGKALLDTLKDYLRDKHLLLILDNFEHVLEAAPDVDGLVKAAPGVKLLATSRSPLKVYGEREYQVPLLSVPDMPDTLDKRHTPALETLSEYEAVGLFIERAREVKWDFQMTAESAPAVAQICARLEGLPLAIELASARIRVFTPQALLGRLERLDNVLTLLTGGARTLPPRQQTLRNTIEWSYDLLGEGEKQLFRRMAVFQGGRTLQALEAVCNFDEHLEIDVLEGVEALVSNSLLQQRDGSDREPRYWMLETIHEYAREKLAVSGEGEALQSEHALYFMRLAEEAERGLQGEKQGEWLDRLEEEHDNMRAALKWARVNGELGNGKRGDKDAVDAAEAAEVGLRIGGALSVFWHVRGNRSEGREQLAGLLGIGIASAGQPRGKASKAGKVGKLARAKALSVAGSLAQNQSDYASARAMYEESLAIFRELGDKKGIAQSLDGLGIIAYDQGDHVSGRSQMEESLAIRRELGDKKGIAQSLNNLGNAAQYQGDYASARSLQEESLAIERELGNKRGIAYSLNNLGSVAYLQGDYATARSLLEESLAINGELGDKNIVVILLSNLGELAQRQGDASRAGQLYAESLNMGREIGAKAWIAISLIGLGGLACTGRQPIRGARLLGAAEALLEAIGAVLEPSERVPYDWGVAAAHAQLDEAAFEKAWQEGQAMSMEQAIEYALEDSASSQV